jgi:hypothetical protein
MRGESVGSNTTRGLSDIDFSLDVQGFFLRTKRNTRASVTLLFRDTTPKLNRSAKASTTLGQHPSARVSSSSEDKFSGGSNSAKRAFRRRGQGSSGFALMCCHWTVRL